MKLVVQGKPRGKFILAGLVFFMRFLCFGHAMNMEYHKVLLASNLKYKITA